MVCICIFGNFCVWVWVLVLYGRSGRWHCFDTPGSDARGFMCMV